LILLIRSAIQHAERRRREWHPQR